MPVLRVALTLALATTFAGASLAAGDPAAPEGLLVSPGPIADAVRSRFGAPVRIRSLSVHPQSAEIELQDPASLDRYAFEEGALGPDARVVSVVIERSQSYGSSELWVPLMRFTVDGPRGGAVVEYDLRGKHKRTTRW
jgi:hypothetical protein